MVYGSIPPKDIETKILQVCYTITSTYITFTDTLHMVLIHKLTPRAFNKVKSL